MAQMSGPKTDRYSENPAVGRKQNGQKFGVWAGKAAYRVRTRMSACQKARCIKRTGIPMVKKDDLRKPYVQEFDPWPLHTFWILAKFWHSVIIK